MSAALQNQASAATSGEVDRTIRKRRTAKAAQRKRNAAPAGAPTPARKPGRPRTMQVRVAASRAVPNEIAAGFATTLTTAGPDWSAEYQTQFMAGLAAAIAAFAGGFTAGSSFFAGAPAGVAAAGVAPAWRP